MRSDRLQRIIDLKERLMEEKERILEQYSKTLKLIENNINILEEKIDTNYDELCTKCLNGNEFSIIKDYLEHLGQVRTAALAQKDALLKSIAAVRAELYEMLKEIKMLDSLKAKTVSIAKKNENRRLQKLLDEIALRPEGRKT